MAADHIENPYSYRYPHPAVTTDVVVFSISDGKLKLLLIKRGQNPYTGSWAVPGGFLEIDESLEECARRELKEETGMDGIHLEQLHAFGKPGRDPRERVVSVAFYAIAPTADKEPLAGSDATDVAWFPIEQLPKLAFDHSDIIALAHKRLTFNLNCSTIAFRFLSETFTLSETQKVYEIISNNTLDKRNFRKSIINSGVIEETDELRRHGNHRPARLYRLADHNSIQSIY